MIATDHSKCTMHAVYLWHITWWHSMALCLYFYFLVEKVWVSVHKLRCFRITYIFFLNCSLLIQILHSAFIIDLMFVQPFPIVFIYRSPDPQSYGIRRWSLWGIIRVRWDHESGAPMMRLESLYRKRKGHQNLLFLPCDNPLYSMKRALTKNWISQHLDLGLSASRTVGNNCLLFNPHDLWCFVIAAQGPILLMFES